MAARYALDRLFLTSYSPVMTSLIALLLIALPSTPSPSFKGKRDKCEHVVKAVNADDPVKQETLVVVFTPHKDIQHIYNWRDELLKIEGLRINGIGRTGATVTVTTAALAELRKTWGLMSFIEEAEPLMFPEDNDPVGQMLRRMYKRISASR